MKEKNEPIMATVFENGPLVVKGEIIVKGIDGKEEVKQKSTAFCRCGASSTKPYCDGGHKKIDFIG
jgi:CDGSH-type Zn-finger protein